MQTVTVTEAKAHLNELVEQAETTHEQVVITRHGRPSAVILAADDLESLQETVYWLSQPGIRENLDAASRAGGHFGREQEELVTTKALRERLNHRG